MSNPLKVLKIKIKRKSEKMLLLLIAACQKLIKELLDKEGWGKIEQWYDWHSSQATWQRAEYLSKG